MVLKVRFPFVVIPAVLLASCSAPVPLDIPDDFGVYVALGDSFAAMGSASADTTGPVDCYRSIDNYPSLVLSDPLIGSGTDATCSSAQTADVLANQIDTLTPDTNLVTLSIGGNDIRFGDIATCFADMMRGSEVSCTSTLEETVTTQLATLPADLDRVYTAINQRNPDARIITTGYLPLLSNDEDCAPLDRVPRSEVAWAVSLTEEINSVVRDAAARHSATFVLPENAFAHTVCADPTKRWADVTGVETDAYPMHPTPLGQKEMAAAVLAEIRA